MKTVLFSDVHLDAAPCGAQRRTEFSAFLRHLGEDHVERIVILGDLFDFWFEYRHVVFSGFFEVLRAFADLRDAGIALHLVCGNHDFWGGRFLSDELGFQIHRDTVEMTFGNQRALLCHGDGLNPADRGYLAYKRIARSHWAISLFGLLHPDWAMGIARKVSHGSRALSSVDDPTKGAEAEALRAFAKTTLAKGTADVVLCGHAHAPTYEEYPTPCGTGIYINTGDWMYHRSRVEWNGQQFQLLANPKS